MVLAASGDAIIEVGGSIVMDDEAYARLRASSQTVWLRASPEEHLARVRAQGDMRPMSGRKTRLGSFELSWCSVALSTRSRKSRSIQANLVCKGAFTLS